MVGETFMKRRTHILLVIFVLGIAFGTGLATFYYAEGGSYFSSDPSACVNCHIMRPQYESWLKSSHKNVADCVDCHLPHGPIEKYLAKAENGYHHSKAFTLQDFHEPIQIKEKNSQILQKSCLHCHQDLVHATMPKAFETQAKDPLRCVHCHADVGHGEPLGMGVLDTYPGRKGLEALREALSQEATQ